MNTKQQGKTSMTRQTSDQLDTRLVTVEKEVAGIKTDVSYIRSSIDSISAAQQASQTASRTNWGILAAWASVILSIAVYHGSMTMKPVEQSINGLQNQTRTLWEHNDRHEEWYRDVIAVLAVLKASDARQEEELNSHRQLFERVENKLDENAKANPSSVSGS